GAFRGHAGLVLAPLLHFELSALLEGRGVCQLATGAHTDFGRQDPAARAARLALDRFDCFSWHGDPHSVISLSCIGCWARKFESVMTDALRNRPFMGPGRLGPGQPACEGPAGDRHDPQPDAQAGEP